MPPRRLIECQPNASSPLPAAGAVLFGAMPHLICARRSRLTYGVGTIRPYRLGDPPQSKFWHEERRCFYTADCFKQYVSINQLVSVQRRCMRQPLTVPPRARQLTCQPVDCCNCIYAILPPRMAQLMRPQQLIDE
jgi:hypothetical protein